MTAARRGAPSCMVLAALLAATQPARASGGTRPDAPAPSGWTRAGQAESSGDSLRVLTHTPEHCRELVDRAAALRARAAAANAEAALLAQEGERLCAHGQFRPGIMRLRRAVMMLRGEAPADSHGQ